MLSPTNFRSTFEQALSYDAYLATAKPNEAANWHAALERTHLTPEQAAVVHAFARRLNVLVISGTWCGDCVQQCPILERIAQARPADAAGGPATAGIDLRLIDRDVHADFSRHFAICGGGRVPTAIFLNEDFEFVHLFGDRTLARYRGIAARQLGPSCPLPGAPVDAHELAHTVQDWVDEFERVHLLLRLSPKLRGRHGD